jgi:flavin-dependent dehydrogenase
MLPPPAQADVIVVGAGPAGAACAAWLARHGVQALLADQHQFPRDKVCGDGLIPDAHAALRRLGVLDEVAAHAHHAAQVRCVGPRGGHVDIGGRLMVLPRRTLDHIVVRVAERAGAVPCMPARFVSPLLDGERVCGARLEQCGQTFDVSARWVVLATGAAMPAMIAAGLAERRAPSGVAIRGYVKNEALADRIRELRVKWHPRLRGGYGWIFPAGGGLFNIGAGLTGSHAARRDGGSVMKDLNLRRMLDTFCEVYPDAGELMRSGTLQGELKGAPLRCSLAGARWSRPGLLAAGEAIGSTYAFTGEGIGKALETGLLAAEAIIGGGSDGEVRTGYEAALARLRPRFDMYETASHVNRRPWLIDVVVWRARGSQRIRDKLAGVLEEATSPGRLLSWRGIMRLMMG